jgi:hypothetical protein
MTARHVFVVIQEEVHDKVSIMRHIISVFCIIVFSLKLNGQTVTENMQGSVAFISSENIYVKFKSTVGITTGDTLYLSSNGKLVPALKVINLSSSSCICNSVSNTKLSVAQKIVARKRTIVASNPEAKVTEKSIVVTPVLKDSVASTSKIPDPNKLKQVVRGSISAYSYSNISNIPSTNYTQLRYTFSLDASHIANSKFSVESYISFRHKLGDWEEVKSNFSDALKIYALALRYEPNKTIKISLGRTINPRISSIGAMDGLQIEKTIKKFALGAVVGSRPDYADYSFNSNLFQYGAYLSFSSVTANNYVESSLAFMQQTNNGKTDRRFLYFQHSNSLIKNIYFFSTFEVDLYKLKGDSLKNYISENTFNPTGLYVSLRYKMTKKFDITGSYDARKNVMYYETYKSYIDRILEKEMRQSYRLSANYRITNNLMLGVQTGYRYLKSDPHPSKNVYGYLSWSQIPGVKMSATLSATYLETSYVNGKILGANIYRDFFLGKLYFGIGYRYVEYQYPETLSNSIQNIGEMSLSWQFARTMSFSTNYEGTFDKQYKYNMIYLQLRKRF